MDRYFADSCYWIALLHKSDQHHESVREASERLESFRIVTSEFVLAEVLNLLGKRGASLRDMAVKLVDALESDPNTAIDRATSSLFAEALQVYRDHPDKKWSLVDCSSFVIMERLGLDTALTFDRHYKQRGFHTPLTD